MTLRTHICKVQTPAFSILCSADGFDGVMPVSLLTTESLTGMCAPEFAKEKPTPNVRTAPAKTLLAACYLAVLMVSSCVEHGPGISLLRPRPYSFHILPCSEQAFFHFCSHLYAHLPCLLSTPASRLPCL